VTVAFVAVTEAGFFDGAADTNSLLPADEVGDFIDS